MMISYNREKGRVFSKAKLFFTATNAFAPDVTLFTVEGDGENNATINTFPHSDPVSTLLAAYAISCKLDPKDFSKGAEKKCGKHIRLGMPGGMSEFIGMPEQQFEQTFSCARRRSSNDAVPVPHTCVF